MGTNFHIFLLQVYKKWLFLLLLFLSVVVISIFLLNCLYMHLDHYIAFLPCRLCLMHYYILQFNSVFLSVRPSVLPYVCLYVCLYPDHLITFCRHSKCLNMSVCIWIWISKFMNLFIKSIFNILFWL